MLIFPPNTTAQGRSITISSSVLLSGEVVMAYDHSDKIGNQGDLVKHYALYLCLKKLLVMHSDLRTKAL